MSSPIPRRSNWDGSPGPRASSPVAILLQEARESVTNRPVPARLRPSLDPSKTPFGGHENARGKPRMLPSLKRLDVLESHREGLESRSSEPGHRPASHRNGHSSRSKRRSEHCSGVASAPASRGDMTSEPFSPVAAPMSMTFFEAPQTEPARGRLSLTPSAGRLDTPPTTNGLAMTLHHTPERSLSTPTLHSSRGKPPAVPKRRSLDSRERPAFELESSVAPVSPFLSPEEPRTSAPSRSRHKVSLAGSPEPGPNGPVSPQIGQPAHAQAMPTLPMGPFLGVNPSVWSARSAESSSIHLMDEVPPAVSRRELPSSTLPESCRGLPGSAEPQSAAAANARTPACSRHSGTGKTLAVPKNPSRSRRRHNSAAPEVGPGTDGSSQDASRRRTGSDGPAGRQRNAAAAAAEEGNPPAAADPDAAADSVTVRTDDLLDSTPEVGEQSYGWDEHEDSGDSHGPGNKGKAHASLSCVKGSRGVKAVSLSTSAADVRSEMRAAALQMTLNAPDAVKGTNITWVKGEMLGRGSLGSVFKALDQSTGQIFAVKEVRIDLRDQADVKFRAALENEIDICRDLKHDRIVSYLGHDNIDTRLYIYLEYMPGGSLTQVLSQFGPFEESLIATYTRDLLQGLDYLHTCSPVVLHRDVKGANILVGLDCRVKLSDFGCSKRTADTLSMSLRGSIPWMAPEVIQQTGYGRRSDIWSLGCVVIEMATARHPWGNFDNPMAAMVKIGMSNLSPPLPEAVSEHCKDFIVHCTQRDKNLRPLAATMLDHEFVRYLCDPG